jgi:hypothetical protein
MRSCYCSAATPGLAARADDLLGRELADERAAPAAGDHPQQTITTLTVRRLPRPAGLPAAYQVRSSLPWSGCLTSDTVVNPPLPNSSWVCILTDSV